MLTPQEQAEFDQMMKDEEESKKSLDNSSTTPAVTGEQQSEGVDLTGDTKEPESTETKENVDGVDSTEQQDTPVESTGDSETPNESTTPETDVGDTGNGNTDGVDSTEPATSEVPVETPAQKPQANSRDEALAKLEAAKNHAAAIAKNIQEQAPVQHTPTPPVNDPFSTNPNLAFLRNSLESYLKNMSPVAPNTKSSIISNNKKLLTTLKTAFKFPKEDFIPAMRYIDSTIRAHADNGAFSAAMVARFAKDSGQEYVNYTQALLMLSTSPKESRRRIVQGFQYMKYFGEFGGRINDFYRTLTA